MQILRRLVHTFIVGVVVVVLLVVNCCPILSRIGIDASLRIHSRSIRQANASLQDKERLLDCIDGLRDRIRRGEQIDLVRWLDHDLVIREMTCDGLMPDEFRLIERELKQAEDEFEEPTEDHPLNRQ